MRIPRPALSLAATLALAGCASSGWEPRASSPGTALQWPAAPAGAKLNFERTIAGFDRPGRGAERLASLATGEQRQDRDAFILPVAVAATREGRIAVADAGRQCVHLYDPSTRKYLRLTQGPSTKIVSPVGLAFGPEARLFVTDSTGRIFAFGPGGEPLFEVTRAGGEPLVRPAGIAWNPLSARLYVVDTASHRVDVFRADGAFDFAFGSRGNELGKLNFPTHIAASPSGELYVADSLNFRIQIFDAAGKPLGAFGRHGDGSGDFALPKGVAVDRDGIVYVVDGLFDNVQLFDRRGEFLLTLGERGTGFGEFWLPAGAFISDQGELFVCDAYNRRVQVFRIAEHYAPATS